MIDGARLVSPQRGRRVMVLFTDGDDSTSRRNLAEAVATLQRGVAVRHRQGYEARSPSGGGSPH